MNTPEPKIAAAVRVQYGSYVDPERGIEESVVLLTIDTETAPPVVYALSTVQAQALGGALAAPRPAP